MNRDIETIKDVETLDREIIVSQKIENILRTVHGHILVFKQHYSGLAVSLSGKDEQDDLRKIENCLGQLTMAANVVSNQLKEFNSMESEFERRGIRKSKLIEVRTHITDAELLLRKYIEGIKVLIYQLSGKDITSEGFKKALERDVEEIEREYTAFGHINDMHIRDLKELLSQIGRN